jgi:hypothetical protein
MKARVYHTSDMYPFDEPKKQLVDFINLDDLIKRYDEPLIIHGKGIDGIYDIEVYDEYRE